MRARQMMQSVLVGIGYTEVELPDRFSGRLLEVLPPRPCNGGAPIYYIRCRHGDIRLVGSGVYDAGLSLLVIGWRVVCRRLVRRYLTGETYYRYYSIRGRLEE